MIPPAAPPPAHPLAAQLLQGKRIALGPNIRPERYHLAIAATGSGLDHLAGEASLALADAAHDADRFTHGILFTTRRLLARTGDVTVDVPYPALGDVRAQSGMVSDDLEIVAHQRAVRLTGVPDMQVVAAFLQAMRSIHPGYRVPPARPLAAPTPDDPTGGGAARHDIWSRDPRVLPLLGMAIEGHRRGAIAADLGADLVTRAMLLDRTIAYGRGAHEGWWTSPLGAPDLVYAFARMLGPPARSWQEGHARGFEFQLGRRSNAGAAASTAVGLVALGLFGVGWVSTPGRSLASVGLKIAPGRASTGFALFDGSAPLSQGWPSVVRSLFEILPRIEGRVLLERAAFGWDAPPEQLDEISMEALHRKVAETIGAIDLSMFFPRSPPK